MKTKLLLSSLMFLLSGCATISPQTKQLIENHSVKKPSAMLTDIKFIPQKDGDCGPGSLAMALNATGLTKNLEEIRSEVLTPKKKGSLPSALVSSARGNKRISMPINTLNNLTAEIEAGRPVLAMHNQGFSWLPNWHYVLVVGYDLPKQVFYLHSAGNQYEEMPITYFERHWELADHWAMVVLKPGELPTFGKEKDYIRSAVALEKLGYFDEAIASYEAALKRWPKSLLAHVGLGNSYYQLKKYKLAKSALKRGLELHPKSETLRHNLEVLDQM